MKLSPDKKLDVQEVLKDLDKYRPRRKGWAWRKRENLATGSDIIAPLVITDQKYRSDTWIHAAFFKIQIPVRAYRQDRRYQRSLCAHVSEVG